MGVPKDQATRNRQAIIDTASRVFRERGVDGVGVAELMKQAGFTHGGFYNHFESKDALAAEACAAAFACGAETLKKAIEADPDGHEGAFHAFMEGYLAPQRCDSLGECCPTAALATDAARQGKAMQAAYAQGVEAFIAAMTPYFAAHADEPEARDNAMAMLAGLVGTVVLARGVGAANPVLSEEILDMGRRNLGKVSKRFFFGKKEPKNFSYNGGATTGICIVKRAAGPASRKSFLVLFFKREPLASSLHLHDLTHRHHIMIQMAHDPQRSHDHQKHD